MSRGQGPLVRGWAARLARWYVPVTVGAPLALTLFSLLLFYHRRDDLTVNVGDFGDSALVSGFYADEPDVSYRYRWSKGESEVRFTGAGSAPLSGVSVVAQGARTGDAALTPVTMSVSVNGQLMQPPVVTLTQELGSYAFTPPANTSVEAPFAVTLTSSTFRPPGDGRDLGVKVDSVQLSQREGGLNLPPLWLVLWSLVLVAGVHGLATGVRRMLTPVPPLLVALWLVSAFGSSPMLIAAHIPLVAAVVGIGGLIVWQRNRVARWPEWVDALGKVHIAMRVMLGLLLLYAAISLWAILQVDWIGHADYAENAVVARNLVEGRGFTVDYVTQFYKDYPGITHPAETWPLLQPLMIAPFFGLFGPQTWAAKLPNLFVMLLLAWAVFHAASRLWEPRVGLLAGIFTLAHPYFFNSVLYPINDLPFTALFFALAWLVWRVVDEGRKTKDESSEVSTGMLNHALPEGASTNPQSAIRNPQSEPSSFVLRPSSRWRLALTGALAGLLVWSKPSGVVLLAGLVLWTGWTWWRVYRPTGVRVPWRALGVVVGVFALALSPLLLRNLLAFGTPYFTTESLDAPILRYWPYVEWENIYRVYAGGELPHLRWIAGGKFGYQNLLDVFVINLHSVLEKGVFDAPGEGDYVLGVLPLAGALLGLAALTRRAANLFGMVGLSLGLYVGFVMLYWHFEGRYFQVAVPWLLMLLAWGIMWAWDRLRETLRAGTGRRWGLLFLPIAVAGLLWPHVSAIAEQVRQDTRPIGFAVTMKTLADMSGPQDVVMTRDPWELNWYTRRRAVMIPFDDMATVERVAQQYGVTMLQLGGPVDRVDVDACPDDPASTGPFPTGSRPALGGLYCGRERAGYTLVYRKGGGTIYRVNLTP